MKFLFATIVLFWLSTVSISSALVTETTGTTLWLEKRALASIVNAPTETIYCPNAQGQYVYISPDLVTATIQKATDLTNSNKFIEGYPSPITHPQTLQGMPEDCTDCMHYPIAEPFSGPKVFDGSNFAGNMRVMYSYTKGSTTARFLGVYTHAAAERGQYTWCGTWAQWGWPAPQTSK